MAKYVQNPSLDILDINIPYWPFLYLILTGYSVFLHCIFYRLEYHSFAYGTEYCFEDFLGRPGVSPYM